MGKCEETKTRKILNLTRDGVFGAPCPACNSEPSTLKTWTTENISSWGAEVYIIAANAELICLNRECEVNTYKVDF